MPKVDHAISATFIQGGRIEYMETGVYPEWLYIKSKKYQTSWKRRAPDGKAQGVLKTGGKKVFNFRFDGSRLSIQEIVEGIPDGDWQLVEFGYLLAD